MAKQREINTGDMEVGQRSSIIIPADGEIDYDNAIAAVDGGIDMEYAQAIAFNEQPMTIRVEKSSEKYAPKTVDCWVNGKGIEIFHNGKWLVTGYIPVGVNITTRRKYVEVLARSKPEAIETQHDDATVEKPNNHIALHTSTKYPFTVVHDANPAGAQWLTHILQEG